MDTTKSESRPSRPRRNSSYFKNPHVLRRRTLSPTTDTFSPSDAQWFLRLPDKVQRRHFTPEERILLSGQTRNLLPDVTDEKFCNFYRSSKEVNQSVPTLRTSSISSVSSQSTFEAERPADSAVDMDDSMIWFDDDNDFDLSSKLELDDYHEYINKAASESGAKSSRRQPSYRRALSLTSLPFGSKSTFKAKPPHSTIQPPLATTPLPQIPYQQARSRTFRERSHGVHGSISALEPSTQHYQDPKARLKLRIYLASPDKFDEAIEFGFPSMEDTEDQPLSRPVLTRNYKTASCQTFLHDDNPSLFDALDASDDDDAESTTSLPERDASYTPMDQFFTGATLLSPSIPPSSGSSSAMVSKPIVRHHTSEPFAQLLAGSREMTLRMTLTRPDLRADEKALYASTTGDDPLALEHLPPPKKEADIWDQSPKDRSIVKKIWHKFRSERILKVHRRGHTCYT